MSQKGKTGYSCRASTYSNYDVTVNHSSFFEGSLSSLRTPSFRPPAIPVQAVQITTEPEENLIDLDGSFTAASQVIHSTSEETPPGKALKEQAPSAAKDAKSKYSPRHRPTVLTSYGRRRSDAHKLQLSSSKSLAGNKKSQHAVKICKPKMRGGLEYIRTGATYRPLNVTYRVPRRAGCVSSIAEASSHSQPPKAPRKPLSTLKPPATRPEKVTSKKKVPSVPGPLATSTGSARKSSNAAKEAPKEKLTAQSDKCGTHKETQVPKPKVVVFSSEEEQGVSEKKEFSATVEKQKKFGASHVNLAQPFKVAKGKFKEFVHVRHKDPSKLRKGLKAAILPNEPQGGKENVAKRKVVANPPRKTSSVSVPTAPSSGHQSKSAEKRKLNETMTLDDVIDFSDIKKSTKYEK